MWPVFPLDGFILGVDDIDGVSLNLDDAVDVAVVELAGEVVRWLGEAGGFGGGCAAWGWGFLEVVSLEVGDLAGLAGGERPDADVHLEVVFGHQG